MTTPCNLSIIIPAYNEARTIPSMAARVTQYLEGLPLSWELILVNVGSQDTTAEEQPSAPRAIGPDRVRLLQHPRNLGKGAAVRTGVLDSKGQFVVFLDAAGATPIEELGKFLPGLQNGADVVVGSRRIAGATIRQHQPRLRQWLGAGYTWLTNRLVAPGISDLPCGVKALRREAAHRIFSRMRVTGWSFDAELFYLARRFGYRVIQIPVTWTDQPNTKVRLSRHALTSLWELLRIRWTDLTGGYR